MAQFAIIETGGKQYSVSEGDTITIEQINGLKEGDKVSFDTVLLTHHDGKTAVGTPTLKTKVQGTIVKHDRHKKVSVIRYKAKSRYFKKKGHRQPYMQVSIESIS